MPRVTLGAFVAFAISGLGAVVCAQTTHTVNLAGMSFSPAHSTIDVGDTVRWVWLAGIHDVESGTSGANIGDGKFSAGDPVFAPHTFQVVFDRTFLDANPMPNNVYPYYCSVHFGFGMTGTITVIIRLGDLDRNGRIDLADHKMLGACFGGPGATAPPVGCTTQQFEAADTDGDNDVDLKDFGAVQQGFTG